MAASMDFFRRLGTGAKFDLKRFRNDAERFQIIKPTSTSEQCDIANTLDIFGNSATSPTGIRNTVPKKDVKRANQSVKEVGKRKRNVAENEEHSKRRKKKTKQTISANSNSIENESNLPAQHHLKSDAKSRPKANNTNDDFTDSSDEEEDITVAQEGSVTLMSTFEDKQTSKDEDDNKDTEMEEKDQARQQNLRTFLKQHRIHVLGTDVPDPLGTFREMQEEYRLHTDIVENIHKAGYVAPTPIQMQAIPLMIHRRELLACAPTGSGKTAAFILPVLHHLKEPRKQGFRAVVVSPSRELAHQTYREFMRLSDGRGFRIHMIDNTAKAAKKFGPQSAGKFDILVTTPNRLVYMLKQDPPTIKLNKVEWLIVDESDKLFEGGKTGFREQLATIYQACDSNQVRRAMFSATFTHEVEKWCNLNLDNVVTVTVGQRNAANDTVKQDLMFVGDEYGKLLAVRDIFKKGFLPPVLIFVQSKDRAKELFHELIYDGYNVDVIHADKSQVQRDNVVRSFRAGKIWVLIATELMGRGIDFKGVNLVINYDFPTSAISYIHRIGRTGRAGREGSAITMFTEDDIVQLRSIANVMRNAGCPVPEYMLQLKKLSKKAKKKLEKRPKRRKTIRTLPTSELERAKMKKGMMRNKQRQSSESSSKNGSNKPGQKWPAKKKKPKQENEDGERQLSGMFEEAADVAATSDGFQKQKRIKTHKKLVKKKTHKNSNKGKSKGSKVASNKSVVKSGSAKTKLQKKSAKV